MWTPDVSSIWVWAGAKVASGEAVGCLESEEQPASTAVAASSNALKRRVMPVRWVLMGTPCHGPVIGRVGRPAPRLRRPAVHRAFRTRPADPSAREDRG